MRELASNWWQAPGGLREVARMALPLIISTASWTLMQFTDRVFLLWHSADAVAAALPAGMLSLAVVCVPLGIAGYVSTFVAQYHGARRPHRIGVAVWQAVGVGVLAVPLVLATNPLAPALFSAAGHPPQIAALETSYYQILSFGAGGMVICSALAGFFTGRGDMRTIMVVDTLAAALNVVLDYCWIFGHAGFPALGMAGAGWATVVATWCRVLVYMALWLRPAFREQYQTLAGCRFDLELFKRLLWFGGPSGLQFLFDVGGFSFYLLLIGQLGSRELAASSLAFNVNGLAFMPVYGISMATSTLVGQRLGENRPDLAARATWTAFALAAGLMLVVAAVYVLAPDWLLTAHRAQGDAVEFAHLRDLTVVLLRFVAFYCLFDAMNMIFASAIKGAGDTRFVLLTTLALAAMPVALAWIGIRFWGLGLYWAWVAVTAWVCLLGLVFLWRFVQGRWRDMRVIEAAPVEASEELLGASTIDAMPVGPPEAVFGPSAASMCDAGEAPV